MISVTNPASCAMCVMNSLSLGSRQLVAQVGSEESRPALGHDAGRCDRHEGPRGLWHEHFRARCRDILLGR